MSAASSSSVLASAPVDTTPIRARIERLTDDLLTSFPKPESLTAEERRAIIARYTAVLEGNFIYWMTGAYIATKSDEAHEEIIWFFAPFVAAVRPSWSSVRDAAV